MRTRLQMSAAEARASRDHLIRDMGQLALHVGAADSSIEVIRMALRARYGPSLYVKEAILPATEKWRIRFLRAPGGWLTTGEKTGRETSPRIPGDRLPRYVRLRVPVTSEGKLPRSLAPRREDLPAVIPGKWRNCRSRKDVPTLDVDVDAPRYGIVVNASSSSGDPAPLCFPIRKDRFSAAMKKLNLDRLLEKSDQANAINEQRRIDREERAWAAVVVEEPAADHQP